MAVMVLQFQLLEHLLLTAVAAAEEHLLQEAAAQVVAELLEMQLQRLEQPIQAVVAVALEITLAEFLVLEQ